MASDDDNLWIVGVVLVLLGSLGQNLGNNLVSLAYDRIKKDSLKAEQAYAPDAESQDKILEMEKDMERNDKLFGKTDSTGLTMSHETSVQAEAVVSHQPTRRKSHPLITAPSDVDKSHSKQGGGDGGTPNSAMWYFGTAAFVVGSLSTFAAFGFAAQSLLAALESIQFVSNVVFAKYVHGEVITTRMCVSTLGIVLGNVLVVIFSTHEALVLDSHEIIQLYVTNQAFWIYAGITFFIWCLCEYLFFTYHTARVRGNKRFWGHAFIEPASYISASAIIGAMAVLNSKCLSMLIQVSARGLVNETIMAPFYVILITWILFVAYWLRRLDKGLELFPPLFFIPTIQVAFVFFAIVIGGIYFEEFNTFGGSQWAGFVCGVFMILAGVYGLAPTDVGSLAAPTESSAVLPIDFDPSISLQALEAGSVVTGVGVAAAAAAVPGPGPSGPLASANTSNNNTNVTGLDSTAALADKIKVKPGSGSGSHAPTVPVLSAQAQAQAQAPAPQAQAQPIPSPSLAPAQFTPQKPASASASASGSASGSGFSENKTGDATTSTEAGDGGASTPQSETKTRSRKVVKHGSASPLPPTATLVPTSIDSVRYSSP